MSRRKWDPVNKARARRRKGALTKPESTRAQTLEFLRLGGEILSWRAHPLRLVLAKGSTYAPDFMIVEKDGTITFEEVKGSAGWKLDDEGRTKFKVAAQLFPEFTFRGAVLRKHRGWSSEEAVPYAPFPPVMPGDPS